QIWNNGVYKVTLIGKVKADKSSEKARTEFEKGKDCYSHYDYDCAKQHFEKAVGLDKNNPEFRFNLAQSYRWLGKDFFDKSLENYNICVEKDYRKGDSYACIASIYSSRFYHTPNKKKAKEALEKGAALGNTFCIDGLKVFEEICKKNNLD
ncbi:hypothetical protein KY345_05325, partial [Candidatus Woesearchaeota archaeon]|nr:hypothetical protein [Candidatus Woesearchaeota archaeon]